MDSERRENLRDICEIFNVASASQEEILDVIDKSSFDDVEDCLQDKCAKEKCNMLSASATIQVAHPQAQPLNCYKESEYIEK